MSRLDHRKHLFSKNRPPDWTSRPFVANLRRGAAGSLAISEISENDRVKVTLTELVLEISGLPPAEREVAAEVLAPMVDAAAAEGSEILFLVGGTDEVFTQCSQNLFVKRQPRIGDAAARVAGWKPSDPLAELMGAQFELFQVTVSSSGVPGASPRNGATGRVVYVVELADHDLLMIPYHSGNFIHGQAAKLWSNPYGAIIVRDEHHHLRQIV